LSRKNRLFYIFLLITIKTVRKTAIKHLHYQIYAEFMMRLLKKRLTTGKRDEKGKNRDKKALKTDDDTYK